MITVRVRQVCRRTGYLSLCPPRRRVNGTARPTSIVTRANTRAVDVQRVGRARTTTTSRQRISAAADCQFSGRADTRYGYTERRTRPTAPFRSVTVHTHTHTYAYTYTRARMFEYIIFRGLRKSRHAAVRGMIPKLCGERTARMCSCPGRRQNVYGDERRTSVGNRSQESTRGV